MTAVDAPRQELAEVLRRPVAELTDDARLIEDLALDSLQLMSLLVWAEGRGVAVDTSFRTLSSIGEVLALVDNARSHGLSIRIVDNDGEPIGPADFTFAATRSELEPVMENAAVRLTPIADDDINFLYALAAEPESSFRWRYRGAAPSVDRFVADMWANVLVQFVARQTNDNRPVGHLIAYGADANRRYVHIAAAFEQRLAGTGIAARAVAMFARYLFHTFPFVKLYLEIPGFNWSQLSSGENHLFVVEGVLRDHEYYAGRTWDKYVCAVYRD